MTEMKPDNASDLPPATFAAHAATAAKEGGSYGMLTDGLRALAEHDEQLGASNAVGLRLLAEVQAIADARRRRTMRLSLAAAATLATVLAVPAWRSLQSRPDLPVAADG